MLDVKKLVTGFLILAAGASSSAWILSSISGSAGAATGAIVATSTPSPTVADGNAFDAESGQADTDATTNAATIDNDPTNVTNALADSFLNGLVSANPNGIQTDANGNPLITPPDNQAVIASLRSDPSVAEVVIPNWDTEAANEKIDVTQDTSAAAITSYANAVQGVFTQYFIQPNLEGTLTGDTDPSAASYAQGKIQSALQQTVAIQTPANAEALQQSLVKLLVYQENMLALTENASADPVKTSLIFQAEEGKYNAAIQAFNVQLEKSPVAQQLSFLAPTPDNSENDIVAFVDDALGIQTAHAQWLTFDASSFAHTLLVYAENIVLQILKNTLIALMQQKVTQWIQGSGAPRFIQNWGETFANAYTAKAVAALNQQFQCVPPSQLPQLKVLLATPAVTGSNNACANEFTSQLNNNLNNISNRFTNFNDYFALFQPQGNVWSSLITIQDNVTAQASQAQAATVAKSTTGGGFTGSQVCDDGSNPNGTQTYCSDNAQSWNTDPMNADGSCPAGSTKVTNTNGGVCADGTEPQVTTPATVTGQAFGSAIDSSPKLVTAANDIAGILNALLSSLINTLAQNAISAGTTAVSGAINGSGGGGTPDSGIVGIQANALGGSSNTNLASSSLPAQPGVTCAPQGAVLTLDPTSGQATSLFYASGGATDFSCATNGANCAPSENSDGTPTYTWSDGTTGTTDSATYSAPGTYSVTVAASTDNSTATCTVTVTTASSTSPSLATTP